MTAHLMEPLGPVGTATRCPGCGSDQTAWVRAAGRSNLLCKTCGTCWHQAPGAARRGAVRQERVDVLTCPGCALRAICIAAAGETNVLQPAGSARTA